MADRVARAALTRALEEKDLLLIYQPIFYATDTHRIYAAEALLRQRRETGEIREASIITAAAEEGPELFKLDSWAMKTAYTDASHWHRHGAPEVRLNVNLSSREFQEGNLTSRLDKLIAGCNIDTRKVNLEITETTYIEDPEETMLVLEHLKKLGIKLWLDDFGTGHSSIEHLQHFPLDGLKIAGAFVKDLPKDERCMAICRRIIDLAHDLGLDVIAEGVERQEQLDALLEFKCDYIQGFLLGCPMPREEFEGIIALKEA